MPETLTVTQHRIILFRGMNTGGVRAPVGDQRAMAQAMGLRNPRTLLASGNLVVESDSDPRELETAVEREMEAHFGLKIAAMVRTQDQWAAVIAANPFAEQAAAEPSKVLMLATKDGVSPGGLEALRALAADGERVEAISGVGGTNLYFWHPEGQGRSVMAEKAQPRLIGMSTGRNWNTVLKLGKMVGV